MGVLGSRVCASFIENSLMTTQEVQAILFWIGEEPWERRSALIFYRLIDTPESGLFVDIGREVREPSKTYTNWFIESNNLTEAVTSLIEERRVMYGN